MRYAAFDYASLRLTGGGLEMRYAAFGCLISTTPRLGYASLVASEWKMPSCCYREEGVYCEFKYPHH